MGNLKGRCVGIFLLLPWLLTGLFSCGGRFSVPDYREFDFCAKVSWCAEGQTVVADVCAYPKEERLTLTFTAPSALAGIRLECLNGSWRIRCGEMAVEGMIPPVWLEYAAMIMPHGIRHTVCRTEWQGREAVYAEIVWETEEGEKQTYALYTERESGSPLEIRQGEKALVWREFRFCS